MHAGKKTSRTTLSAVIGRLTPSSIRARLLTLVFFASMPALAGLLYSSWHERESELEAAETRLLAITRAAIAENSENRAAAQQVLLSLAALPMIAANDADACEQSLASIVDKGDLFVSILVADPDGMVWCNSDTGRRHDASIAETVYFQRATGRKLFSSGDFEFDRRSRRALQRFALPV